VDLTSSPFTNKSLEELLSVVLRSKEKASHLAKSNLRRVIDRTRTELGLSVAEYAMLQAGIELGRRVSEAKGAYDKPQTLNSPAAAIEFCRIHFARLIADAVQEEFHVITLNSKAKVIGTHQITVGTLDASLVHPREVFRPAIKDGATSIVLAHNHPSGDPEPSREDIAVTTRIDEVGRLIGIAVLDHIVLGRTGCVSIRDRN
jgi:DNA repair protein RadC